MNPITTFFSEPFNLAWFIPLFPFLAFVANLALGPRRTPKLSHSLAIGGMAVAFVLATVIVVAAVVEPEQLPFTSAPIHWVTSGDPQAGGRMDLAVYVDPATVLVLFTVPLVCGMIFTYSIGYMNFGTQRVDPRYSRFFAYLSLFATSTLGMVVFDNLLAFFIFWQIMGTCSYLLIGFWHDKTFADPDRITPRQAGLKAFLVTRIGDLFFLLGLVLLYSELGSLSYDVIFDPQHLASLTDTFLTTRIPVGIVISLLLFGGTVGKSAQFPLHVWLPDGTEGPTPVSALIHATTMVPAGVFLLMRCFPIFTAWTTHGPGASLAGPGPHMLIVTGMGAFTALFAAITAVTQDDVKGVLAFSTISQLGYMVTALGLGTKAAFVAGTFHLITHAFFQSLLVLGAGSVIQGMERGHHASEDQAQTEAERPPEPGRGDGEPAKLGGPPAHERGRPLRPAFTPNDLKLMGGLRNRMPRASWPFVAGALSLSGFPFFFAGFWSRDAILTQAYVENRAIFFILAVAAVVTAFYAARLVYLIFAGEPRSAAARQAAESPPLMTVPLAVLAVFATTLGWLGISQPWPELVGVGEINWVRRFLAPGTTVPYPYEPGLVLIGLGAPLVGLFLGWLVYGRHPLQAGEMDPIERTLRQIRLGWAYEWVRDRFYVDILYRDCLVNPAIGLANLCHQADARLIAGLVNLVAPAGRLVAEGGQWFDGHVIDRLVDRIGSVGRPLAKVAHWLDVQIVDRSVDLISRSGRPLAGVAHWFDVYVIDSPASLLGRASRLLADAAHWIDVHAIDVVVDLVSDGARLTGRRLRRLQTGLVQNYLLFASIALLTLVGAFFAILFLLV